MLPRPFLHFRNAGVAVTAGLALLTAPMGLRAQGPLIDWSRQSILPVPRDWDAEDDASAAARNYRIHLPGLVPGFLNDPVGLDLEEMHPTAPGLPPAQPVERGPEWLTLAIGLDNPFFEIRRPGDPGGVGYYRLASQVQVLDSPTTAMSLGLQAFTPAGPEVLGAIDGPTTLSPELCFFHQLEDGSGFQAFVSKNMPFSYRLGTQARQRFHYGLVYQKPLWLEEDGAPGNLYFFLAGLGRYRYVMGQLSPSGVPSSYYGPAPSMEVVPGLQWRLTDTFWLSSGWSMPVGPLPNRNEANRLQILWSFQF
jgi:hypothetical protein